MKLLVLGGSVFLSRAVAADAVRRGHDVTCANRGASGSVPDGARLVVWDRDQPAPEEIGDAYDAVVDVARHPSRVRSAVAALPHAHWVFVSTVNVYSDESTPGGRPGTLPLRDPLHEDVDGRPVLGEAQRVLPAERRDRRAQLDPAGALRRGGEHRDRRRDAVLQVPVPHPGAVEAELLAELDQPERGLVAATGVGGVEQPDRQESQPVQHLPPLSPSALC